MFRDVDVSIQVQTYLSFDVNVLKHAFFPMDRHICDDSFEKHKFQSVDVEVQVHFVPEF